MPSRPRRPARRARRPRPHALRHARASCSASVGLVDAGQRFARRSPCRRSAAREGASTRQGLPSRRRALPRAVRTAFLGWSALRAHEAPGVATFHRAGGGPALTLTKPLASFVGPPSRRRRRSVSPRRHHSSGQRPRCATVLFNGFEMERFVATPRERSDDDDAALVLGRFEERKGVSTPSVPCARTTLAAATSGAWWCWATDRNERQLEPKRTAIP
jgi:hypothetical protein